MHGELIVAGLADIPPGEGRTFEVGRRRIAVFHARTGDVFATQADCPHRGGPLADGLVGGTRLTCPLHEWVYDLSTGRPLVGTCDIEVYPIRVTADGMILLLPPAATPSA